MRKWRIPRAEIRGYRSPPVAHTPRGCPTAAQQVSSLVQGCGETVDTGDHGAERRHRGRGRFAGAGRARVGERAGRCCPPPVLADGRGPTRRRLASTAPGHPLPPRPPHPRPLRLRRRPGLRLAPWPGGGPSRRRPGGVRLPQHRPAGHEHHLCFPRPHDRVGSARAPVGRDDRGPLPLLRDGRCNCSLPGLAALPRRHRLRPAPSRDRRCPGAPRRLQPRQCSAAPLGVGRRPQRLHRGHVGRRSRQLEAQRALPVPVGGAGGDRGVIGRCHLRVDDARPDQQLEPGGGRALRLPPG